MINAIGIKHKQSTQITLNVKRCGTVGLVRKAHNLKVASSSLVIALFVQ